MKLRKWFGHREKTSLPETDASDEERLGSSPPPCASHDFGTEQIPEEAFSARPNIPIPSRDLHLVMRTRTNRGKWQDITAYIDPGNTIGPMVSLERVLMLGYGTPEINFGNSIQIMTHRGLITTIGTISLIYAKEKYRMALGREFHIWEEDMGRFDVCFPASDDASGDFAFMRLRTGHLSRYGDKVSQREISRTKKRIREKETRWWIFVEYRINANIETPFNVDDAHQFATREF